MANILHVELSDTFNKQRQAINQLIDQVNTNLPLSASNGISITNGDISIKATGDGLSFDGSGNLIGNDAYPNLITQVVVDTNGPSIVPTTITSTYIDFPAFQVIFDKKVFYGTEIADFETIDVPATRMNVVSGIDGAVFVYVDNNGDIHQSLNQISPENSSTQCLLGSYFRLNNQIQSGSWGYTPWNGSTSKDHRFSTRGSISGGLLVPYTTTSLSRMSMTISLEGVNFATSIYQPNRKDFDAESTYSTKAIWPGYNAAVQDTNVLDTTHIYNMTTHQLDDISSKTGYIVLVPGVVGPTGQDVYLMAMSEKVGNNYTQIFPTMADAISSIYGLQVELGNVATRVLWIGQCIVVKIGATDYTDDTQLKIIGNLPNVLGSYVSASSGGAGSRVSGITVKAAGSVIGDVDQKTVLNFDSGFTVLNTSGDEVAISTSLSSATQTEVNNGTNVDKYITPNTLKNQNYLATIDYVGNILQQSSTTSWPSSSTVSTWPHTIIISTNGNYTLPTTLPTYTDKVLTWEVVIKNTGSNVITLVWPAVYQAFNGETLPDTLEPNTAVFVMMRKYSNNYTLVSMQGHQDISLM